MTDATKVQPRRLLWWEPIMLALLVLAVFLVFAIPGFWITPAQDGSIENAIAHSR